MSARQDNQQIRQGMNVRTADGQVLGTVERMQGNTFTVKGQSISQSAVARVTKDGVYLDGSYATGQQDGEMRVAVAEEQLTVGKREVELGAVEVRKTVTEEQQSIPVTLRREEVTVQERDTAERPLRAGEDAFQEGTIRVAVRGEEAVVAKEAVVTGEVVIDKQQTSDQRTVSDTVRKEHVDVDENYTRARADLEQRHGQQAQGGRTFEQAEPQYRAGYSAATDPRFQGREFEGAEPELRTQHETSTQGAAGGDSWEQLRHEVREGWQQGRS